MESMKNTENKKEIIKNRCNICETTYSKNVNMNKHYSSKGHQINTDNLIQKIMSGEYEHPNVYLQIINDHKAQIDKYKIKYECTDESRTQIIKAMDSTHSTIRDNNHTIRKLLETVVNNFKNAPPLEFSKKGEGLQKKPLDELVYNILAAYSANKNISLFIAGQIAKHYAKKDPQLQSMWSYAKTKENVIRKTCGDSVEWRKDDSGERIINIIIKPYLKYIAGGIKEYIDNYYENHYNGKNGIAITRQLISPSKLHELLKSEVLENKIKDVLLKKIQLTPNLLSDIQNESYDFDTDEESCELDEKNMEKYDIKFSMKKNKKEPSITLNPYVEQLMSMADSNDKIYEFVAKTIAEFKHPSIIMCAKGVEYDTTNNLETRKKLIKPFKSYLSALIDKDKDSNYAVDPDKYSRPKHVLINVRSIVGGREFEVEVSDYLENHYDNKGNPKKTSNEPDEESDDEEPTDRKKIYNPKSDDDESTDRKKIYNPKSDNEEDNEEQSDKEDNHKQRPSSTKSKKKKPVYESDED